MLCHGNKRHDAVLWENVKEGAISGQSYRAAGVDIDAAASLVERIKGHARSTARAGSLGGLGGFGALFDLKASGYQDPILVSATDGVGTKLRLAIDCRKHDTVGIDLVAMCVNDLIVQGAEPLFFLDYFATGKLALEDAEAVVSGIAEGCRQAGCALIGGETAEMPGMYADGDYDLAGFSVGAVERDAILPRKETIQEGDRLIGLRSSGVHSNGFSLVRKIIADQGLSFQDPAPFEAGKSLGESLLTPTRIYVSVLRAILKNKTIKALAHITGGGLCENLPRILPESLVAEIESTSWTPAPVFQWLAEAGKIPALDMVTTFNCGIGMVLVVDAADHEAVLAALQALGEDPVLMGQVIRVNGAKGFDQVAIAHAERFFKTDS